MITGELRNQVDRIWDAFWSGGISNPLEVIEQITYLLFLRRLDELETLEETKARTLGQPVERRIFPVGKDGDTDSSGRTDEAEAHESTVATWLCGLCQSPSRLVLLVGQRRAGRSRACHEHHIAACTDISFHAGRRCPVSLPHL